MGHGPRRRIAVAPAVVNDAFGHPQSVVVLGGTSEIAEAILDRLGRRCRQVVLAGRDQTGLDEAAARLERSGIASVSTLRFDATDAEAGITVERCLDAAGGQVDLVLVAVGLLGSPEGDERDPARVAELVAVNFAWPAAALAAVAEHLRRQGAGRIVVLSSVAGVRVRLANFVYGSAKAGLDGFAWGLAATLATATGGAVSLHIVRPGFVHSKMTAGRRPAPFATTPEAVADAVVTGLERSEPVIWVPPVLKILFGILRLLPDPLWRRLPG